MRLRILGASGGIGGRRRTTAFLIDDDLLLDAGTGAGDLNLDEMAALRGAFVTHAHLDHVAGLFLILDSMHAVAPGGLRVRALPATLDALSTHLCNDAVWPDFRRIPTAENPLLTFEPIEPGVTITDRGRRLTPIEVCHTVPAVGYYVSGPGGAFAFSGDTGSCPGFWEALNRQPRLDRLFVEVSFPDSRADLARMTGHFHPSSLAEDLKGLKHRPEIWLCHVKPRMADEIEAECRDVLGERNVRLLQGGETFEF